jgi:P-type Ca2+ transporter type 2C
MQANQIPLSIADLAKIPAAQVYTLVNSRPYGLTTVEAQKRLAINGKNLLQEGQGKPLIFKFLANFVHLMALLLWAGGALAFVAQMPQLGIAIWIVILINAVFSFWQEYKAEKATEALKKLLPSFARILRDGEETRILAEGIVPGDILLLAEGDNIPADGRFVEEFEVRTNNATLTGESAPVRKTAEPIDDGALTVTEMRNLAFAGTSVASGTGKVVVINTGMNTQFGKIANLTQTVQAEMSPLQKEMARITRLITILAVGMGVIFFILGAFVVKMELASAFIFAIGIIVANVPEGLLPTVTLALAMGVQRMAKRNALIKKLSSVETLGSTTVICTDKTGTLTQNAMTVREAWTFGNRVKVTGNGYEPIGEFRTISGELIHALDGDLGYLLRGGMLCNNAKLIHEHDKAWDILGDPTEAALVVAAAKANITPESERYTYPRTFELPFDSRRKRMSTIHQHEKQIVVFVKGAPQDVLLSCTRIQVAGEIQEITEAHIAEISRVNDEYANSALRVLAVAYREVEKHPPTFSVSTLEQDLIFIGLMGMMDPPRPEVTEAVERCRTAGIRTVMITGDYGLTAESIAHKIGLVSEQNIRIITGAELESMTDDDLKSTLDSEVIFARVAPEHKLRVVTAFQEKGHVVAVTGDGVNDAPALKKADIGVAMGITGTDVAKEAADMILTDDNFASIVNAIEEGRGVYDNIKKFVTYILASNIPELIPFIAMVVFNLPLALTVMQILAVDLGTDMLPALALGTEPPEHDMMSRPPRPQNQRLLNRNLLSRAYLWLGMIETALCYLGFFAIIAASGYVVSNLFVNCAALTGHAAETCQAAGMNGAIRVDLLLYPDRIATDTGYIYVLATSLFHMGVIAGQVGNAFACRTEKSSVFFQQGWRTGLRWLLGNRFLLVGIVIELILINILVYLPPFQMIFEEGPIPPGWWLLIVWYAPILFILEEGRKAFVRWLDGRRGASAPAFKPIHRETRL